MGPMADSMIRKAIAARSRAVRAKALVIVVLSVVGIVVGGFLVLSHFASTIILIKLLIAGAALFVWGLIYFFKYLPKLMTGRTVGAVD